MKCLTMSIVALSLIFCFTLPVQAGTPRYDNNKSSLFSTLYLTSIIDHLKSYHLRYAKPARHEIKTSCNPSGYFELNKNPGTTHSCLPIIKPWIETDQSSVDVVKDNWEITGGYACELNKDAVANKFQPCSDEPDVYINFLKETDQAHTTYECIKIGSDFKSVNCGPGFKLVSVKSQENTIVKKYYYTCELVKPVCKDNALQVETEDGVCCVDVKEK